MKVGPMNVTILSSAGIFVLSILNNTNGKTKPETINPFFP